MKETKTAYRGMKKGLFILPFIALAVAGGFMLSGTENLNAPVAASPGYAEKLAGLKAGTEAEVVIVTRSGKPYNYPVKTASESGRIEFGPGRDIDLDSENGYALAYHLAHRDSDSYTDISFHLDKASNRLVMVGESMDPGSKVSLSIDSWSVYKDVPVDWGGRIELTAHNQVIGKNTAHICARISASVEICHTMKPGGLS